MGIEKKGKMKRERGKTKHVFCCAKCHFSSRADGCSFFFDRFSGTECVTCAFMNLTLHDLCISRGMFLPFRTRLQVFSYRSVTLNINK